VREGTCLLILSRKEQIIEIECWHRRLVLVYQEVEDRTVGEGVGVSIRYIQDMLIHNFLFT